MKQQQGESPEAMGRLSFGVLLVSQLLATTAFMFVVPFMPLYVQQLVWRTPGTLRPGQGS